MRNKTGRYSGYIRPFSYVADIVIIVSFAFTFFKIPNLEFQFAALISSAWLLIAAQLGFYEVYRYTKVISILNCAVKQFFWFIITALALVFLFNNETNFDVIFYYVGSVFLVVLILKLFIYYFLKEYRIVFGGNFRNVILVGNLKKVAHLQSFFTENLDYGYKLIKLFTVSEDLEKSLQSVFSFVLENNIDELYFAMSDLNQVQLNEVVDFANNNLKTIKFIPDENQVLTGNFVFQYYGYFPIIALRTIRLDEKFNKIAKRFFDILFSSFILIGVLSWLAPIVAIFIKLESTGPIFFKQKRNGLNNKLFDCYKFRSMQPNDLANINQVSKNDERVTKVGKFLRKTSFDELPQFYNVFIGDMSVVGPRPHMVSHTKKYALTVDKFMVRHFIKPGITGLAQTRGFRGEIESENDIINRVKYDIFYLENWSILLDIKIVFTTIFNIIKGDKKAY